jgi:hypothetical protein
MNGPGPEESESNLFWEDFQNSVDYPKVEWTVARLGRAGCWSSLGVSSVNFVRRGGPIPAPLQRLTDWFFQRRTRESAW